MNTEKSAKKTPPSHHTDPTQDAPLRDILLYAFGNIEGGFANQFINLMKQLLVVVMLVNPLLIGLAIGIKSLWDGVTDPIMAHITDNTRSRWGRRIPYILVGGVLRMALLVFVVLWIPKSKNMLSNEYLETDKQVAKATEDLHLAHVNTMAVYRPDSIEPLERMDFSKFFNRKVLRKTPDPREVLQTQFEKADASIDSVQEHMPHIIGVLESNLVKKTAWMEEADPATEVGRHMRAKRAQVVQEAKNRLAKAHALLDRSRLLSPLHDAAATRKKGSLNPAERIKADAIAEQLKRAVLQPITERMPRVIEAWRTELERLESLGEDEKPRGRRREKYLTNARNQVKASHTLLEEARQAEKTIESARESLAEGRTNVSTVALTAVYDMAETARRLNAPPPPKEHTGMLGKMRKGWEAYMNPANADQRSIFIFFTVALILFTTFSTIQGVPYYALGIELCPSYDGRTRVAVYRSIMDKTIGFVRPWIPTFCFLLMFKHAFEGLFWTTLFFASLGIFSTVLMSIFIRERTFVPRKKKPMGLLKSIRTVMSSSHFWRVNLLYWIIGISGQLFGQFGFYLNVYWVMGSAFKGAWLSGIVQSLAWGLCVLTLPLVNWGCRRYQKHNVLQVAVIMMAFGSVLQWWTISPKYPYLQLIMPFFTSIGISSFYVVMGALLADVTDADELKHGERREGMFAAVMSLVGKIVASITPLLAGVMLVVSGFEAPLEYNQTPQTIINMRLLYSIVPGAAMSLALLLLWRYPLNRKRMEEIKAELKRRHDAEEAAEQETAPATHEEQPA